MSAVSRTATVPSSDSAYQAFQILRLGFTVAPIVAGLDKFLNLLTDWSQYLAPMIANIIPAGTFMMIVGAVEIVAGILVFIRPRFGGYLVAAWLALVIINLLMTGDFYDIALRDLGLLLGALSLGRLAEKYA